MTDAGSDAQPGPEVACIEVPEMMLPITLPVAAAADLMSLLAAIVAHAGMIAMFVTGSQRIGAEGFDSEAIGIEIVTMAPALLILNAWGQGGREIFGRALRLHEPWQFFWATGVLSSFLDNAPTYLTFSATAPGMAGVDAHGYFLREFLASGPDAAPLLAAISAGTLLCSHLTQA